MNWQDIVLSIANLYLVFGLGVAIFSKTKVDRCLGGILASALLAFSVVYFSLHLWVAASLVILQGLGWGWLIVRRPLQR